MKYIVYVIIIFAVFNGTSLGQLIKEDAVPVAIKQTFKQKFPAIKGIEWKIKADKNYEAEFTENGTELAVKFSPDGKWLETESAIKATSVPDAVMNAVSKDYPSFITIELQSIEATGSNELVYEIHIKKDTEILKLQYSNNGKLLNKTAETGI